MSTDQHIFSDTKEAWLHFCLLTPIKSSNQEPWKGMIKQQGQCSLIKILDPSCKHFYRRYVSDYPLTVFGNIQL